MGIVFAARVEEEWVNAQRRLPVRLGTYHGGAGASHDQGFFGVGSGRGCDDVDRGHAASQGAAA
jgi:hypothetical protein